MDGDIGYQLRSAAYDKKSFGLGGITLSTFARPGTNYEAIVEETIIGATHGSGPVIPLIKFDIQATILNFIMRLIDFYEWVFPVKWKDAVSYFFELPPVNRQLRMSFKFAENIISSYCFAARQRCFIDDGVTLADARRTMSSLVKTHGREVIPRHVVVIISHESTALESSSQRSSLSLPDREIMSASKSMKKNAQKAKEAQMLKFHESEAKAIMKSMSFAIDFILWSLELEIQFVTVHEALGKLVIQYGEMASIISERLSKSTARIRLYFPSTNTSIQVFANSWEVVSSDWAHPGGNEDEFIGLTAIIHKVGEGYMPKVRKTSEYLHGMKNSDGKTVTPNEVNISSLVEFAKTYAQKHAKRSSRPTPEQAYEEMCKTMLGTKYAPQLLVLFGSQQFLEGFPYYLLGNAVVYSPPHHSDKSTKMPNVKDYVEGLVAYSKTLKFETESSQ